MNSREWLKQDANDKKAFLILRRTIREFPYNKTRKAYNDVNFMVKECLKSRENYYSESLYQNMLCWPYDCGLDGKIIQPLFMARIILDKDFQGSKVEKNFIENYLGICDGFLTEEKDILKKYCGEIKDALSNLLEIAKEIGISDNIKYKMVYTIGNYKKIKSKPTSFYIND